MQCRPALEAAVELAEAQHFAPNLNGPASRREPSAKEEDVHVSEGTVVLDEDDSAQQETDAGAAEHCVLQVLAEKGDAAEFLLGIDDLAGINPCQHLAVLQEQFTLIQREGDNLNQSEQRRSQCKSADEDASLAAAATAAAKRATHAQSLLDLRQVAKRMGRDYSARLEECAAQADACREPATLAVRAGDALDTFAPQYWMVSFVEFF